MKRFIQACKAEKHFLIIAFLIFLVSAISGYMNADALTQVLKQNGFYDQLEEISRSIKQNPSFLHVFVILFKNNIFATFSYMVLGLLFGIVPFISMLSNGMILGVILMNVAEQTGQHPIILFVTTILPHGIVEIPALIIAAGFGLRLGTAVMRRLLALFIPRLMVSSVDEWKGIRTRLPVLVIGVTVLIFVAAIIEASLITFLS